MSSNAFTSDVSEGAVTSLIKLGTEQIKVYINKFINKDLLFIGKEEIIKLAKEQKKTEEWLIFNNYVSDKKIRILIQVGLTLRELESDYEECERLRQLVLKQHGADGLHIAQFVQNGFLGNLIGTMLSKVMSKSALREDIETTLRNVERFVVFVKNQDNIEQLHSIIKTRIETFIPKILILYSYKSAMNNAKRIKEKLELGIQGYIISDSMLDRKKYICFFIRDEKTLARELSYILPLPNPKILETDNLK